MHVSAAFKCGRRSIFDSIVPNLGGRQSTKYPNNYYSIAKGTGAVNGYTYFGLSVDGLCTTVFLDMDRFLFQMAMSPANLCSIAGGTGASSTAG